MRKVYKEMAEAFLKRQPMCIRSSCIVEIEDRYFYIHNANIVASRSSGQIMIHRFDDSINLKERLRVLIETVNSCHSLKVINGEWYITQKGIIKQHLPMNSRYSIIITEN